MQLFIVIGVAVWMAMMTFVGPKMTQYSRRQWALLMATLFVLWIPMGSYFLSVVVPAVWRRERLMRAD
jgi:hypothetical protein